MSQDCEKCTVLGSVLAKIMSSKASTLTAGEITFFKLSCNSSYIVDIQHVSNY